MEVAALVGDDPLYGVYGRINLPWCRLTLEPRIRLK